MPRRLPSKRLRLSLGLAAAVILLPWLGGAGAKRALARVTRAQYRMGTVLEIDALGAGRAALEAAVAEAFRRVGRTEDRLSNWRSDSELSRANRDSGARAFALSPETFGSLRRAFELARETGGAFDPTVGGVTRALGLTGQDASSGLATRLAGSVGWSNAVLDENARTLRFRAEGTAIDSGAFGKGEALDRAVAALRGGDIAVARLNFGGQIALLGAQTPAGRRLAFDHVAVAAPDASGRVVYRFRCADGSVSTSGDAEKPGHLIDPRTGAPPPFHGSVTVVADTALRADALSTALFVMGPADGLAFSDRRGIAALYVFRSPEGWEMRPSREFRARCPESF